MVSYKSATAPTMAPRRPPAAGTATGFPRAALLAVAAAEEAALLALLAALEAELVAELADDATPPVAEDALEDAGPEAEELEDVPLAQDAVVG